MSDSDIAAGTRFQPSQLLEGARLQSRLGWARAPEPAGEKAY
jgi:hypothetical protein